MLHTLSMKQALSLWSDLEQALHGKHHFGGDTAEVYISRLMPFSLNVANNVGREIPAGMFGDMVREAYDEANGALLALCLHFQQTREAHIEVEGRELGDWLATARFQHRVQIKVVPERQ